MHTLTQPTHNHLTDSTSTNQVSARTRENSKHVKRTLSGIKALAKHQAKKAIDLSNTYFGSADNFIYFFELSMQSLLFY